MAGDDDLRQQLADRFAKGIAKTFSPCPLVGPKWMQACPGGKPADFRFLGVRKLAKAIGISPARIFQKIMPNISLGGLSVNVDVTDDFVVLINRSDGMASGKPRDKKPSVERSGGKSGKQQPTRPKPRGAGGPNRKKTHKPKPREE